MSVQQRLEHVSALALIAGALAVTYASFQNGRAPYMVGIILFAVGTVLALIAGWIETWS